MSLRNDLTGKFTVRRLSGVVGGCSAVIQFKNVETLRTSGRCVGTLIRTADNLSESNVREMTVLCIRFSVAGPPTRFPYDITAPDRQDRYRLWKAGKPQ